MRFPLSWLRDYIPDFEPNPVNREKLELAGLEIEEEILLGISFKGISIGEILEIQPHPHKEHLLLTKIRVDGDESATKQIVCGAHNIKVGNYIPVAFPGSIVEGETLGARKIGGILSEGMLLSLKELGFPEEYFPKSHEGIFIIHQTSSSTTIEELLSLPDTIWEIKVFPNRSDLLSIKGMAREIAAILNLPFYCPEIEKDEPLSKKQCSLKVEIDNFSDCSYYSASLIENVSIKESPSWMQIKLLKCGLRPINNVVDATNYVMLELGQPLHAFDYTSIQKDTIKVRRGKSWGESLLTLDDNLRSVDGEVLLIATTNDPIGIAGIIGGINSGITEHTKKVVLESAYFSPEIIRSGRRKLGISTDASYRFERGLDPFLADYARIKVLEIMKKISDSKVISTTITKNEPLSQQQNISFTMEKLNNFLGTDFISEEIFKSLGHFQVKQEKDIFTVDIPSYRRDLSIPEDIYEEVARIIGYHRIPSKLPVISSRELLSVRSKNIESILRENLCKLGLTEVVTSSMLSEEELIGYGKPLSIKNPISKDLSYYRSSLIPGMLKVVLTNIKYGIKDLSIFEMGHIYNEEEKSYLAILCTGRLLPEGWKKTELLSDFYYIWGILNKLSDEFNLGLELTLEQPKKHQSLPNLEFLHPSRKALVKKSGYILGYIGEIHPLRISHIRPSPDRIYVAELDLKYFKQDVSTTFSVIEPSRFPHVERHLSLTFPTSTNYNSIEKAIFSQKPRFLEKIILLDRFNLIEKQELISFTISFIFRANDHTLKEEEVRQELVKIVNGCSEIGGELRGRKNN